MAQCAIALVPYTGQELDQCGSRPVTVCWEVSLCGGAAGRLDAHRMCRQNYTCSECGADIDVAVTPTAAGSRIRVDHRGMRWRCRQ